MALFMALPFPSKEDFCLCYHVLHTYTNTRTTLYTAPKYTHPTTRVDRHLGPPRPSHPHPREPRPSLLTSPVELLIKEGFHNFHAKIFLKCKEMG